MDVDERKWMDELVRTVVGAAYEVSNTLGVGFLEKVYENALVKELALQCVTAQQQVPIPVFYKGERVGDYYSDIIVEAALIVELKCCDSLANEHMAQTINYLKATGKSLAPLINFQSSKVEWRRVFLNY